MDPRLYVPKVIEYFEEQNVIIMQDLGMNKEEQRKCKTLIIIAGRLESLLTAPQHLTDECACVLAGFISRLHEQTKHGRTLIKYKNDASTHSVLDFVYVPIAEVLRENGVSLLFPPSILLFPTFLSSSPTSYVCLSFTISPPLPQISFDQIEVKNWEELSKQSVDVGKELYDINKSSHISVLMGDFWPASIVCKDEKRKKWEQRDEDKTN